MPWGLSLKWLEDGIRERLDITGAGNSQSDSVFQGNPRQYLSPPEVARQEATLAIAGSAAFFSYSRDDSEFALRLAGDLKAAGAMVWLDQLDISPGQRWDREVML